MQVPSTLINQNSIGKTINVNSHIFSTAFLTSNVGLSEEDEMFWQRIGVDSLKQLYQKEMEYASAMSKMIGKIKNYTRSLVNRSIPIVLRTHETEGGRTDGKEICITGDVTKGNYESVIGIALHEASHILLTDFTTIEAFAELARSWPYNTTDPESTKDFLVRTFFEQKSVYITSRETDSVLVLRNRSDVEPTYRFMYDSLVHYLNWARPHLLDSAQHNNDIETELEKNPALSGAFRHIMLEVVKPLINIIEDRRIDNYVYTNAPGYRRYYRHLYTRFFRLDEQTETSIKLISREISLAAYIANITNIHTPIFDETNLPDLDKIYHLVDLPKIERLDSVHAVADVANSILEIIFQNVPYHTYISRYEADASNSKQALQELKNLMGSALSNIKVSVNSKGGGKNGSGAPQTPRTITLDQFIKENLMDKTPKKLDDNVARRVNERGELTHQQAKDFIESMAKVAKDNFSETSEDKESITESLKSLVASFISKEIMVEQVNKSTRKRTVPAGSLSNKNDIGRARKDDYEYCDEVIVINGISENTLKSPKTVNFREQSGWFLSDCVKTAPFYVGSGIAKGKQLAALLKTRDEEFKEVSTRKNYGKLSSRLLPEYSTGNVDLFERTSVEDIRPAYVHISLDASGSMRGTCWDNSMEMCVALIYAFSTITSVTCELSLRGTASSITGSRFSNVAAIWNVYNSQEMSAEDFIRNYVHLFDPGGGTPEGLCYEAISARILRAAEGKDAFFINLCDGEPLMGTFRAPETIVSYNRKQVLNFTQNGINVLSYFISNSSYVPKAFTEIYKSDGYHVKPGDIRSIANTINSLLVRQR